MNTNCWIIHQPGRGEFIVCDDLNRTILFADGDAAMIFLISNGLHLKGFVCQFMPDADRLIEAMKGDGQDYAWYER